MKWLSSASGWAGTHAQVKKAGEIAWGTSNTDLIGMIGKVLNVGLSMLGLVFLGFALYAGFKWMTAQGDAKAVAYAKDSVRNNVIGLIIIMCAYALTNFVVGQFDTILNDTGLAPVSRVDTNVPTPDGQNAA